MAPRAIDLLRRTDAFAHLKDAELRELAKLLKERRLPRNQVLFRQGDAADALYLVVTGRLRVSATQSGQEKVLAFLGAGEVVGEMGLLSGRPRSATVVATADVELLQLRRSDFEQLAANKLAVLRDLARTVVRRNDATQRRAVEETTGAHRDRQALVTTFFSPRGGAGTTTLATNLAVALAERTPDRVILLDLNVLFGHAPVLLNLVPRTSLAAISPVSMRQMDRENLEFYLTKHAESSLRVLSAALRPEQGELITADHARAAIEIARNHFVHVIVDLGRGFSEVNLAAIESSHNLLVVCTPDRVAVRGVSETQRIFRELVHLEGDPLLYVLNHPSPYVSITPQEIERTLTVRFVASIPYGGDAPMRAALEGQPVVMRSPTSSIARGINQIADLMDQQLAEVRALSPAFITLS